MFGLKGAFYYLVAIQISIIKFYKKIYFSTNYYYKSLQSKIPNQVYFNPNPFLLSIISPFKKKLFKINEINPNDFWLDSDNNKFLDHHNFLWLNLINRKTDGKNIQKVIYLWMLKYSKFKRKIWETSTLSSRVISWILNIDIIIKDGSFDFKKNFFQNIITHCNHLKNTIRFEKDFIKKAEILTALILSGLAFKEYKENYENGIKDLEKFVKSHFDSDGFPLTRSPDDLIFLTKYFILCLQNVKDAQQYVPEFLEEIVEKNLKCISFIKTPEDKIPLFNGGSVNYVDDLDRYIEDLKIKKKYNDKNVLGGIFRAKSKNQVFFMDTGSPPSKNFSKNYQSGPLSFEYFVDGVKVITNCGFGKNISTKAELISRFTASQSTLTINDTSITKFERNKLVNRIFGNAIKNSFNINELNFKNDKTYVGCSLVHNGYEKNFKCIHQREIYLNKEKNSLSGVDHIMKKSDGVPVRYVFRFHVDPAISVVKTMSGNSALLQISRNKSLIFTIKNENLELEKSIFLGGKKILDNTCITITGNLVNKNKTFYWEIKKNLK